MTTEQQQTQTTQETTQTTPEQTTLINQKTEGKTPAVETPEQKAAREAAEKPTAETPEQKTQREAKERADAAAAAEAEKNDTKKNPFKADEIKFATQGIEIDAAARDDFVKLVNEEGLSRPLVQKLIALQEKATVAASEKMNQAWTELQTGWRTAIEKDPDVGGANKDASLSLVSKAIDLYARKMKVDPHELRQAFDVTGAGDNPAIFKFVVGMARELIKEGTPVPATPQSPDTSLGSKIYTKGLQKE